MLSQTGHPIKKDALVAIMDHFNIDATNPVICLTQARSRNGPLDKTLIQLHASYHVWNVVIVCSSVW